MGNPFRTVLIGLLILTAARLVLIGAHEIQEDEAYYFMWSERPALSYYSKGPGISAAMWVSTSIFGANEFGVRFFSPILALGTSLLLFKLARSLFDERVALWSVVLVNVTPIFTAGSALMTIDPLSIFFWVAAMFTFWRALHKASFWAPEWPLAGLCIGLGILAKYTNALQLLSVLIILLSAKRWRVQFLRPGFYIMFAVAALCTAPIWIWNASHGWITFTHLKERGQFDEPTGLNPLEFFEFLGSHFGTYSPILFFGLLWALLICVLRHRRDHGVFFLLAFSLPIITLYFTLSFREAGEQNWTAPGFIAAGILLAFAFDQVTLPVAWKSRIKVAALVVASAMSLVAMQTDVARYLGLSWPYAIDKAPDHAIDQHFPEDRSLLSGVGDPSQRMRGWLETAGYVDSIARAYRESSGEELFLIANSWQCAAAIAFYLPDDCPIIRPTPDHPKIHVVQLPWPQNQFSFWPRYDIAENIRTVKLPDSGDEITVEESAFTGKTALYISDESDKTPPPAVENTFGEWELISVADIVREAPPGSPRRIRRVKVFACPSYRPPEI